MLMIPWYRLLSRDIDTIQHPAVKLALSQG